MGETMILAMGAARMKIPVIMTSGDDQFEKEVRRNMPWVKVVQVKRGFGLAISKRATGGPCN